MKQYEIIAHVIVEANSADEALCIVLEDSRFFLARAKIDEL